jgi:hypothetical protein
MAGSTAAAADAVSEPDQMPGAPFFRVYEV